jgi:4-alpha-glucanotransferase
MTRPISLLFGVHAHQPVGNFPAVIEEAHVRCYRMFLQTVERYPEFKFSVHFSGWLLDWLLERFPGDMARLETMTRRGQVEWFGSGDCEPVLASIPHRDRLSQIKTLSDKIERLFGQRPRGAWLTERVWESSVVPALADCGIEYVPVDDYHFLCAGEPAAHLDSHFTTEEDDRRLDLFPISEQARYRLPFSPAHDAVAWLEQLAREGHRGAVYFDDIEKFGIWPETYRWVYEQGWLTRFIEGVLKSPLIRTQTYAEFYDAQPTRGVVYLPTTSYIEMNEWTLPAPAARCYHALVEQERQAGRLESRKANLRGGIWRNFFMRYPESNWMHKRMLDVSRRLAALTPAQRTPAMTAQLHRAQANDAYWHGLFGGLYLPHLRRAIWNNLLPLEGMLDALAPRPAIERHDVDCDGFEEIFLRGGDMQGVVRANGDAMLIELSNYILGHNFGDTLRQHDEGYYDKLRAALGLNGHALPQGEGVASAHDRIAFRDEIEPEDLEPDARPRGMFEDCWFAPNDTARPIDDYHETGPMEFACQIGGGRISKSYRFEGGRLAVRYRTQGLAGRIEIRLNIAMPSCDGYSGRYILENGEIPCGFGQNLDLPSVRRLILDDGELRGSLTLSIQPPLALTAQPHMTVSQSEAGFEKIMQGADVLLLWMIDGSPRELAVTLEASIRPA